MSGASISATLKGLKAGSQFLLQQNGRAIHPAHRVASSLSALNFLGKSQATVEEYNNSVHNVSLGSLCEYSKYCLQGNNAELNSLLSVKSIFKENPGLKKFALKISDMSRNMSAFAGHPFIRVGR